MQRNFTPEDLIKHLYHENTPEQAREIEIALERQAGLKAEMEQLIAAKAALDNDDRERPHPSTLERIMAYASEKSLQETH
jgi:hypothetical protein